MSRDLLDNAIGPLSCQASKTSRSGHAPCRTKRIQPFTHVNAMLQPAAMNFACHGIPKDMMHTCIQQTILPLRTAGGGHASGQGGDHACTPRSDAAALPGVPIDSDYVKTAV
jgi:hypothetical protein